MVARAELRLKELLVKLPQVERFMQPVDVRSALAFTWRCNIALAASEEVFVG